MENWEFLLQRKGDKSWLPLESPTVEILEGQYRIASRSEELANELVGIAISYRPLADVRHQPIQQKVIKRISHDGLLIVMPYTSFTPGIWQIDCVPAESSSEGAANPWRKTVKFDVIQVSVEFGSEWQYNDSDGEIEDLEDGAIARDENDLVELSGGGYTNILGITQTDPTPLSYSSPILDIAEQRSTELVESMFEEFSLFEEDEDEDEEQDLATDATSASMSQAEQLDSWENSNKDLNKDLNKNLNKNTNNGDRLTETSDQPRSLLQLRQLQYIVEDDNSFMLTGTAYSQGEIEIILKNPQNLEAVVQQRFALEHSSNLRRGLTFAHRVSVPPPSTIQVLIGEVIIHTPTELEESKELERLDLDRQDTTRQDTTASLLITQQAIAVSYPAARVLPEIIKEAQRYQAIPSPQPPSSTNNNPPIGLAQPNTSNSYPQSPQSFPQAEPQPKTTHSISLPPLPSNRRNAPIAKPQSGSSISLPPLPPLPNRTNSASVLDPKPSSFPQSDLENSLENQRDQYDQQYDQLVETNLDIESGFEQFSNLDLDADLGGYEPPDFVNDTQDFGESLTDYLDSPSLAPSVINPDAQVSDITSDNSSDDEQELTYSFEEDLPQNYEELLEQNHLPPETEAKRPFLPIGVGNRFLNKLQNLSAEAIAAQRESQRNEDLLLDPVVPSDRLETIPLPEILSTAIAPQQVDLEDQSIRTIQEANSLAELDQELEEQLDRLTLPNSDRILHEYVWEETVDPNTFPVSAVSNASLHADNLAQTAQTIRNIQDTSPLSDQVPIPIPEILIPAGEVISGTPMIITVRLPAIAPKCFIKFWIKDLQTRTIIDGPRWLLDFTTSPNSEFIETRTNISIPLSSIDVAFEAITLEAQTQRESHKTRVTRAVTPPNFAQELNLEE